MSFVLYKHETVIHGIYSWLSLLNLYSVYVAILTCTLVPLCSVIVWFVSRSLESSHISLDVLSSHPTLYLCFLSEMRWWGVILDYEALIASIITGKRHRIKQQSLCFQLTFMNIYSCYYCHPLHIIHLCFHPSYYCKSIFWKIFPRALFVMLFTFYTAFFKIFLVRKALIFVNI